MKYAVPFNADLTTKVKTITAFSKKVITVYDVDDMIEQLKHVPKPAVGILYEGARRVPNEGGKQVGVSGEAVFSIMLAAEVSIIAPGVATVARTEVHELLDDLREAIQGTRAPNSHFWAWQLEAQAAKKGNVAVWLQRWSAPIQLPPRTV
jgi:hypothetical protein